MEEKSLIQKLEQFLEDEARTYSVDFGCVTPLYVYRMWGGKFSIERIENGFAESHFVGNKRVTKIGIHGNLNQ